MKKILFVEVMVCGHCRARGSHEVREGRRSILRVCGFCGFKTRVGRLSREAQERRRVDALLARNATATCCGRAKGKNDG